jgi:hypothetical protein
MMRFLNTILVIAIFSGLVAGLSLVVRVGMHSMDQGIAINFKHQKLKPVQQEAEAVQQAGAGFGGLPPRAQ